MSEQRPDDAGSDATSVGDTRSVPLALLFQQRGAAQAAPEVAEAEDAEQELPAAEAAELAIALAREEGRIEGRAELQQTVAELRDELVAMAERHQQQLDGQRQTSAAMVAAIEHSFASELANLAFFATRFILKAEPHLGEATLKSLVTEAVSGLPGGTLRCAAAAAAKVRALAPVGWAVAPDDDFEEETIEAEAGPSLQRASLGERLQALLGSET